MRFSIIYAVNGIQIMNGYECNGRGEWGTLTIGAH